MIGFHWMPFMFWISAGLTLISSGLAIALSNPKSIIITSMIAEFGIFLLLITLSAFLPAIIFLITVLLLNIFILYGLNLSSSDHDKKFEQQPRSIYLRAGICALLFLILVIAFRLIATDLPSEKILLNPTIAAISPDVTLLLILSGLLFLLIFIAINHFMKRE